MNGSKLARVIQHHVTYSRHDGLLGGQMHAHGGGVVVGGGQLGAAHHHDSSSRRRLVGSSSSLSFREGASERRDALDGWISYWCDASINTTSVVSILWTA